MKNDDAFTAYLLELGKEVYYFLLAVAIIFTVTLALYLVFLQDISRFSYMAISHILPDYSDEANIILGNLKINWFSGLDLTMLIVGSMTLFFACLVIFIIPSKK